MDVTQKFFGAGFEKPLFIADKSNRMRGANRDSQGFTGVAIQAGGDINR